MPRSTDLVIYDPETRIWSAPHYPHWDFVTQTVGEAFLQCMRTIPTEHVLEYYVDTEEQRTAGQIYAESVAVARSLMRLGFRKGDIIVLYSRNNTKTTPLIMGCLLMGAIVTVFETNLSPASIDSTLQKLQPAAIFYEKAYTSAVADSLKRSPLSSVRYQLCLDEPQEPNVSSELFHEISDNDLACFKPVAVSDPQRETAIYALTSGSTGTPKIVDISHSLLLNGVITWFCHTVTTTSPTPDCVVFSFSPLRWISQIDIMLISLLFGAKRVCAYGAPSGPYGREIIRKGRITHAFITPQTFQEILDMVEPGDTETLSSLRVIQLGGETPSKSIRNLAQKRCGNAKAYFCYGMTEVGGVLTNDEHINGGKLGPGMQLQILDDNMQPLGPNQHGQLYIKMPMPFKPYIKIDNSSYYYSDGFFLNGDYGFMDEQCNLHVETRYKDLVRAKDFIINPNHVEFLISKLPDVAMARLVGYKKSMDIKASESGALFVILKNEVINVPAVQMRQKIREFMVEHLDPLTNSHIDKIHIVTEIPLTSCGKVDRGALKIQASLMS